jgi:hypothetical protein
MKAKFSGHETFPIRYGWLYKILKYIENENISSFNNNSVIENAIIHLGVGKNMVSSMRYWADACGLLDISDTIKPSYTAKEIFLSDYGDPYLEIKGSTWLLHFLLNFNQSELSSYRYFFNYFNGQSFEKNYILNEIDTNSSQIISSQSKVLKSSVSKDIDVFLSMYVKKNSDAKKNQNQEELFVSPLSELGLIKETNKGFYHSELKYHPDLPVEVFLYALLMFVKTFSIDFKENPHQDNVRINFEALLAKPFSPGRIFRLNESGLSRFLDEASRCNKNISWSDNLGLRQIVVNTVLVRNADDHLLGYVKG